MIVRHFLLLIFFIPAFASAQGPYTSSKLWFEVDEKKGCAPFTVTITNIARVHSCEDDPCQISWGDNATTLVNTNTTFGHTYTAPGTYVLEVNYSGGQGPDTLHVTVYPNVQPAFEVYTCSGNDVQVRVTDTNYSSYIIDFNGTEVEVPRGSSPVTNSMASGNIQVRGKNSNSADNCVPPAQRSVTLPLPPFTHRISQLVITNSSTIDLEMETQQNVLYRLEVSVNNGSFQNVGNLVNVSTRTVTGLNTDNNFYCFRLGKVNPCVGSVNYSDAVCSADLAVTAQNNVNNLVWNTSTLNVDNFTIIRNGTPLPSITATTYSDGDVECGTEYCYQIITNYPDATSTSTLRCVTAISNTIPSPVNEVTSVVDGSQVTLTWQPDAVFDAEAYTVFRQAAGGSFNQLQNGITVTQYTDEGYSSDNDYCYRIHYEDACGNTSSAATPVCPIVLTYTTNSNDEIVLSWDPYNGWASGVQRYEIYKYDLQHNQIGTPINRGLATTFTDDDLTDQGYYYIVRAIPIDADNGPSVSNELAAIRQLRFAYPKAFTPDDQGPAANETFRVFVTEEFIDRFEMKIFNRWGEMIFSTMDLLKGWDGKFNGTAQPEGTYTFIATLKDKTGRTYKRDGAVMLLRKK